MSRGSSAFRRMAWLALVAVLLGALVPAVSRVLASGTGGAAAVFMEMCTPAGRQMVDVSVLLWKQGERPPPPAAPTDEACAYCVLAPPLQLVLALVLALLAYRALTPAVQSPSPFLPSPRNLRGLGSRAPPPGA